MEQNNILQFVKQNYVLLFILLVIIVIMLTYKTKDEFSGTFSDNGFSDLTCLTAADGKNYIFKISPSLNVKSSNGTQLNTLQTVLHPVTKLPLVLSDFVNPNDNIQCNDASFSGFYTTKIRDKQSKPSTLLNSINGPNSNLTMDANSTWQTQECNKQNINAAGHWCNNVYNSINNPAICKQTIGKVTPKFCNSLKALNSTYKTESNNFSSNDIINYIGPNAKQIPCNQMCARSSGAIPQSYTDSTGKLVCLKDGGIVNNECVGNPLFNLVNDKIVDSYSPGCKRCATRASTPDEKQALANSGYKYTECMKQCPYQISKSTLDI